MIKEAELLRAGKVGVVPTDTLYGTVARAEDEAAVERVYALKQRAPEKPCIILIASLDDLTRFTVELSAQQRTALARYWPGPVSVVLSCGPQTPYYLHRGTHTLAFRLPDSQTLQETIKISGPLIAPSANPEGLPPATTLDEARAYFGAEVDFYVEGGMRTGAPSALVRLAADGTVEIIREGKGIKPD